MAKMRGNIAKFAGVFGVQTRLRAHLVGFLHVRGGKEAFLQSYMNALFVRYGVAVP